MLGLQLMPAQFVSVRFMPVRFISGTGSLSVQLCGSPTHALGCRLWDGRPGPSRCSVNQFQALCICLLQHGFVMAQTGSLAFCPGGARSCWLGLAAKQAGKHWARLVLLARMKLLFRYQGVVCQWGLCCLCVCQRSADCLPTLRLLFATRCLRRQRRRAG